MFAYVIYEPSLRYFTLHQFHVYSMPIVYHISNEYVSRHTQHASNASNADTYQLNVINLTYTNICIFANLRRICLVRVFYMQCATCIQIGGIHSTYAVRGGMGGGVSPYVRPLRTAGGRGSKMAEMLRMYDMDASIYQISAFRICSVCTKL